MPGSSQSSPDGAPLAALAPANAAVAWPSDAAVTTLGRLMTSEGFSDGVGSGSSPIDSRTRDNTSSAPPRSAAPTPPGETAAAAAAEFGSPPAPPEAAAAA